MAFNIGQYKKNNSVKYISNALSLPSATLSDGKIFFNINIIPTNKYYIKINIQQKNNPQIISIILKNATKTQNVYICKVNGGDTIVEFDNVFTPIDEFTTIEISATGDLSINDVTIELHTILNILNEIGVSNIKHLGFQGQPYLLLCINGNPVRIGRSGLFEINNDNIGFDFIGVIPTDKMFIIDYQY